VVNWQFRWSNKTGAVVWLVGLSRVPDASSYHWKTSRTETVNPAAATRNVEAGVTLGRAQAAAQA